MEQSWPLELTVLNLHVLLRTVSVLVFVYTQMFRKDVSDF
jgi:hypothetical protein